MTQDLNKNITAIIYNHLNLPLIITFGTGDKIEYFYQADGVKVQKVVTQGTTVTTTDYIDGIQYTNNVLDFIPTAEGYVKNTVVNGTNTYSYVYNYTDHLGNVRLSYAKSPGNVLTILEENNNYPFGMKHSGYNGDRYAFGAVSNALALVANGAQSYQYKYNGKEFQGEMGLDWSDYGARNYDAGIGRWMNVDPLAESSRRFSPYTYALNNPVYFIDPDGMRAVPGEGDDWFVNNETGQVVLVPGASTLTQETADKVGAGDASNYDRLGPDNMLGEKVPRGGDDNILDSKPSQIENPRSFFKRYGFEMANKVNMEETTYVTGGGMGAGENSPQVTTITKELSEPKITYVKSEALNKMTNVSTNTATGTYSSTQRKTYTLTTPYGKKATQATGISNFILAPLKIISSILTDWIDLKKK